MNSFGFMKGVSFLVCGFAAGSGVACGGAKAEVASPEPVVEGRREDDKSRCTYVGRDDREVQESSAPGSKTQNVRRVFGFVGEGERRMRILLCREVDTNYDGIKDLVRTYDDKGEKLGEQADSDYDGRIDTWITFVGSRPGKVEIDHDADGVPDEVRSYVAGRLVRVQKDTNADGRPDQFEVYVDGRLDRIGVDVDFDGQVDRWDRDEIRAREEALARQREADGASTSPENE